MGRNARNRRNGRNRQRRSQTGARQRHDRFGGFGASGSHRSDTADAPFGDAESDPTILIGLLVNGMEQAAAKYAHGDTRAALAWVSELAEARLGDQPKWVDLAATRLLVTWVGRWWSMGWLPEDIHQMARRNVSDLAASLAADAMAEQFSQYPTNTTHPTWFDHLARIGAQRWWDASRPHLSQWAHRGGIDRTTALLTALQLVVMSFTLPRLPTILPLPGTHTARSSKTSDAGVDQAVLGKVRGLLAKAESTQFPHEAEALSAKAQELMSRYAIERAMLDAEDPPEQLASARRIWLENPYQPAKALLVANVAEANHCRTVSHERLGFVAVLGDELDLDTVALLATSLMVQATRAMLAEGRQVTATGSSRTRSFRQSFLISYAYRIGERLRETTSEAVAAAGAELVPVLMARRHAVDALLESLYPATTMRSYSVNSAAGWAAGRTAADRASLSPDRGAIPKG